MYTDALRRARRFDWNATIERDLTAAGFVP
jgi:hypothetical protein